MTQYKLSNEDSIQENKASEFLNITEKTIPAAGDLLLIEDSEASYVKKRLQIGNLPQNGSGSSPAGVLTVAPSGGDYTSIQTALNSASAGQTVLVYPGTYNEHITTEGVNTGVRLTGFPNALNCVIKPTGSDSTVKITKNFTLREVTVYSPDTGSNPAIDCVSLATGSLVPIINVPVVGQNSGSSGISGFGGGKVAILQGFFHNGGNLNNFIEIIDGDLVAESLIGNAGSCTNFINISGGFSQINGCVLAKSGSYYASNGVRLYTGSLQILNLLADNNQSSADNALRLSGDGYILDMANCQLHSITNDILIDSGSTGIDSKITFNAVDAKDERIINNSNNDWYDQITWSGFTVDTGVQNDPAVRHVNELHVGKPRKPAEFTAGTGDSTVVGMLIYTDDGTGTNYTNVTTEAKSVTGSTFTTQGTGSGESVIYYGSTLEKKFHDIKVDMVNSASLGSGSYVGEVYTTASTWATVNYMVTDTTGSRQQYGQNAYTRKFNRIRLDDTSENWNAWESTDPGIGTSAYWFRLRNTGSVAEQPNIERIKIGYERAQINSDGSIETMGTEEAQRTFWTGNGEELSVPSVAANAPTTLTTTISTNVSYQQQRSNYRTGQDNRAGKQIPVPVGLDTSKKVTMKIRWITDGTDTNTVNWRVYLTLVENNDVLSSTVEELSPVNQNIPGIGVANKVQETEFDFRIPDAVPGDSFAFSLWRMGGTDTNPDDAGVLTIEWRGYFWK